MILLNFHNPPHPPLPDSDLDMSVPRDVLYQ